MMSAWVFLMSNASMCSPLKRFQSKAATVGLGTAVGGTAVGATGAVVGTAGAVVGTGGTAVGAAGAVVGAGGTAVGAGAHAFRIAAPATPVPRIAERFKNSRRVNFLLIFLLQERNLLVEQACLRQTQ